MNTNCQTNLIITGYSATGLIPEIIMNSRIDPYITGPLPEVVRFENPNIKNEENKRKKLAQKFENRRKNKK